MLNDASTSVHLLSTRALEISRGQDETGHRHQQFLQVQQMHRIGMIRVQTLRECLDLHIDVHHCE